MTGNQERRSLLCPRCKRLISIDESPCPHCGLRNPGSRWRNNIWTKGFHDGDQLIRSIIYLNAAMFILAVVLSPTSTRFSMSPFAFLAPGDRSLLLLGATGTIPIDKFHRWWTLLSANYLHAGILHILFNMAAFYQIAPLIVQEYGGYRMVCIYTLSGVGGYVVSYFAAVPFTLGASAAVCGLIGAALYYGKSKGGYFGQMIFRQVGGWVLGIFVFGFLFPGINNWAHAGGLVGGILTGFVMGYGERRDESPVPKVVAGVCAVATLGALIWGIASSLLILMQARLG
jgi:rhomboid protease GluP